MKKIIKFGNKKKKKKINDYVAPGENMTGTELY
jgi:hypothetical protein